MKLKKKKLISSLGLLAFVSGVLTSCSRTDTANYNKDDLTNPYKQSEFKALIEKIDNERYDVALHDGFIINNSVVINKQYGIKSFNDTIIKPSSQRKLNLLEEKDNNYQELSFITANSFITTENKRLDEYKDSKELWKFKPQDIKFVGDIKKIIDEEYNKKFKEARYLWSDWNVVVMNVDIRPLWFVSVQESTAASPDNLKKLYRAFYKGYDYTLKYVLRNKKYPDLAPIAYGKKENAISLGEFSLNIGAFDATILTDGNITVDASYLTIQPS